MELVLAKLAWPDGRDLGRPELVERLADLAAFAVQRNAPQLAELAQAVIRDPDSPDQLYQLGYALIDAGAPEVAATVLWHCLALVGDGEEVVCELVSALESALAHQDAFDVLAQHEALRARSFLPRYLYAYNAAMTGRLDIARATLPTLAPTSPETEPLHATIAGIVGRADRVDGATPLDPLDLRGWHYVLSGSLVMHQSPYGFDEPMHGRFAWLADSIPRVAYGIDRLGALIAPLGLPCVYAPAGRDHEILAEAIARRLGMARAPWPVIGVPAPGLVCVYDLANLPAAHLANPRSSRPTATSRGARPTPVLSRTSPPTSRPPLRSRTASGPTRSRRGGRRSSHGPGRRPPVPDRACGQVGRSRRAGLSERCYPCRT